MTKVITIPEFQIDDVKWKDKNLYVYYSPPNATEAPDDSFVTIPLDTFYDWMEDNGHLTLEMELPCYDEEQELHYIVTEPRNIEPKEFRLLSNLHTWPIIKSFITQNCTL